MSRQLIRFDPERGFDVGLGPDVDVPTSTAHCASALASFALDEVPGWAVVVAAGEIDISTSHGLREALDDAVHRSHRVIIDLTQVTFLDSTGMAVMVAALHQDLHPRHGVLGLVGPGGVVARALEVTGLNKLFRVFPSVEAAVVQLA